MPRSAQGEDTNHFWNLVPPPAASSLTPSSETASLRASSADGNARCCGLFTTSATPLSDRASESGFRTGVSEWGRAARAPAEIASTLGEESAGAAAIRLIAVAPTAAAGGEGGGARGGGGGGGEEARGGGGGGGGRRGG